MGYLTDTIERSDAAALLRRVERLVPTVADTAAAAERAGRLDDGVVAAMHDAGLYRMMLDPELGGAGLSMADAYPVMEAMARVDGAAGWNLCIGSTSLLMAAQLLPTEGRAELLADDRALIAGGANPTGLTVRRERGGYRFDGLVPFASGSSHATWILATGMLVDDDGPVRDRQGAPQLWAGLLEPRDVEMLDTWRVSGLRATASCDIAVDSVAVPAHRIFGLANLGTGDPLGSLPFPSRLGAGIAFVALGIATHAVDLACDLARGRSGFGATSALAEQADTQVDIADAVALIGAGHAYVDHIWRSVTARVAAAGGATPVDLASLRLAYVTAVDHATAATDLVHRAAGSASLFEDHGLARCWRDVHAAAHHIAVSRRHLARLGRVLLGGVPGPGFI